MAAPTTTRCDVLVVGGGFAGRTAARRAGASGASVVLVDAKTFFEFTPSASRCIVCPAAVANAARPHQGAGRNVRVVHGVVDGMTADSATVRVLSDGGNARPVAVCFKYCIWAGGAEYQDPIRPAASSAASIADRRRELGSWRDRLAGARSILVVGGGLVGVELAAELVELPRRLSSAPPQITLAASGRFLLPRLPPRAGARADAFLSSRGVKRVTARLRRVGGSTEYVSDDGGGVRLSADVVFDCTGSQGSAAGDALRTFATSRDRRAVAPGRAGMVRVRDTLQLYNADNIFVAGDAAVVDSELALVGDGGLGCEKTAYAAVEAGRLAAANVVSLLHAANAGLRRYPTDAFGGAFPRVFAVSLGKWDGVLCFGPVVVAGPLAALTKWIIEWFSVRAVAGGGLVEAAWSLNERFTYSAVRAATCWQRLPRRQQAPRRSPHRRLSVPRGVLKPDSYAE